MATTTQEQQYELNQGRSEIKQGPKKSQGFTPEATSRIILTSAEITIILGAAITVDAIDLLDLTVVLGPVVRLLDIPTLGALWLWRILKAGPGKDPTFALLTTFLVEISPIGMIPTWTILVIYIYFQDMKLGEKVKEKAPSTIKELKKLKRITKRPKTKPAGTGVKAATAARAGGAAGAGAATAGTGLVAAAGLKAGTKVIKKGKKIIKK